MNDENPPNRQFLSLLVVGCVIASVGLVWLVALSFRNSTIVVASADRPSTEVPTSASSPDAPAVLSPQLLLDFDLETGSSEFSGVALNEDLNRLLIADDEGEIFEFDLTDEGRPIVPPLRSLRVDVGAGDIEGIAWMSGREYVIAHENDGRLTVVEFDDEATVIGDQHLRRTIDTGIREIDGSGLEGVAFVGFAGGLVEFVVVDERPPTVVFIDRQGNVTRSIAPDLDVPDLSDIWALDGRSFSLLSDERPVVVDVVLDGDGRFTTEVLLTLSMTEGSFAQPEGLVRSRDLKDLYVVGESPGPARFVFGWWHTD